MLEWAADANVAVVPYGGGTSVVGGVEPRIPGSFDGAVSLDLGALDRVLEVDPVSRAARIGAGAAGPRLEEQLGAHGLTMRFYPQSFELSTLGGWIATRAGGHFATGATHVDDLVEAVRAITPSGTLGVAPAARLGRRPLARPAAARLGGDPRRHHRGVGARAAAPVAPGRARGALRRRSSAGAEAVRAVVQAGLRPANCRLIDALEAQQTGAGDGERAVLVLGFESTDHDVEHELARALELCRAHGGEPDEPQPAGARRRRVARGLPAHALPARHARAPRGPLGHLRDGDHVGAPAGLPRGGRSARRARRWASARRVTCRLTHVYPDGPAPYFTVLAPARRGDELEQWLEMKSAASDAILAAGGTITHHHAVGRDHRPLVRRPAPRRRSPRRCARPRPPSTPRRILNPGVLLDP